MKTHWIKNTLMALVVLSLQGVYGQYQNTFTVSLLKAKFIDTTASKDVILVFQVLIADTANYPPQINFPPKCTIEVNGMRQDIPIATQDLSLTLDDDRIVLKNVRVYDLIKDKVNLQDRNKMMFMTFTLNNLSYEQFKKMWFTFSLSEKRNKSIRWEKTFEFTIDK
jgi:hypothetical protein